MVLHLSCSSSSSNVHSYYHDAIVTRSQPIPLRSSPYSTCDDSSTVPVDRLYSPLSSSAESLSSIKSSCSSRSWAEREMERVQRRKLLDSSLLKIRGSANLPLRKHLLVYNTIKNLQRDLDLLDDEELYCNLMGLPSCDSADDSERMNVDECRWMRSQREKSDELTAAPPVQEERNDESFINYNDEGFEMEDVDGIESNNPSDVTTKTWSWSSEDSGADIFDNLQESRSTPLSSSSGFWPSHQPTYNAWACEGANGLYNWGHSGFDLWGAADLNQADPLGTGRFELQHLFPSQLLLQA
ncbi:unnamed protein product [Caenorhabditis auriculariae]|uniref:SERTA domain-containing protein n=1 Tax=Caenorhabditis auriculariae TaxID=2777116 RepID=A0A8S1HMD5_9PELO|nr:unnamed protein product [Caenorhabditis auriculariae]